VFNGGKIKVLLRWRSCDW